MYLNQFLWVYYISAAIVGIIHYILRDKMSRELYAYSDFEGDFMVNSLLCMFIPIFNTLIVFMMAKSFLVGVFDKFNK